ncbi:cupredoxin domain-containing protein [Patescibacteria group bacterium]|nr:cupredoxin domain-containing protein [Patescibacteria group bacterium]MCL5733320.1 cupredoxin domain-containing protein [Patescibacteria group bacterium]
MNFKSISEKINALLKSLTKREIILIAVIIVLVIIGLVFGLANLKSLNSKLSSIPAASLPQGLTVNPLSLLNQTSTPPITYKPISGPVTVPGTSSNQSGDVAIPTLVIPAPMNPFISNKAFSINISANTFNPSKIAVYQGDIVNISFSAKDKAYDVFQPDYGWKQTIPQGATKLVAFQAYKSGQFTFYCPSCGGPSKGPVGYLFVVSK